MHRAGLGRTLEAIKGGSLTLGFIGGSITDPRPGYNWPEPVAAWFVRRFPGARIAVENAAIGATGSELAVFRAQRDLIDRGCDLVFIEFAVNDNGEPPERRARTREGLVRKLLAGQGRDLMLVYTFCEDMRPEMAAGEMPASIADFEAIADHYAIPSAWMGLHALRQVEAGQMTMEEWLPDGLHPEHRGSASYGECVVGLLEKELLGSPSPGTIPTGDARPAPLNPHHWESAAALPFSAVRLDGPWLLRRWPHLIWMDQVLEAPEMGPRLAFDFQGTALSLGFDFGQDSADFRYRLDGADWAPALRDRPEWCGPSGWYRITNIADDLEPGTHRFELEVVAPDPAPRGEPYFRLALIGVVG